MNFVCQHGVRVDLVDCKQCLPNAPAQYLPLSTVSSARRRRRFGVVARRIVALRSAKRVQELRSSVQVSVARYCVGSPLWQHGRVSGLSGMLELLELSRRGARLELPPAEHVEVP